MQQPNRRQDGHLRTPRLRVHSLRHPSKTCMRSTGWRVPPRATGEPCAPLMWHVSRVSFDDDSYLGVASPRDAWSDARISSQGLITVSRRRTGQRLLGAGNLAVIPLTYSLQSAQVPSSRQDIFAQIHLRRRSDRRGRCLRSVLSPCTRDMRLARRH
jgi:hypothetical protein